MRKTYYFGDRDSASNLRDARAVGNVSINAMNTNVGSTVFNQASSAIIGNSVNYVGDNDNDDNQFSPRDNYDNLPSVSPGAFGPPSDGIPNQVATTLTTTR